MNRWRLSFLGNAVVVLTLTFAVAWKGLESPIGLLAIIGQVVGLGGMYYMFTQATSGKTPSSA